GGGEHHGAERDQDQQAEPGHRDPQPDPRRTVEGVGGAHSALPEAMIALVTMPSSSSKNFSDSSVQLPKSFSTVSRFGTAGNGSLGSLAPSTVPPKSTSSRIGRKPVSANCRWPASLRTKSSHSWA